MNDQINEQENSFGIEDEPALDEEGRKENLVDEVPQILVLSSAELSVFEVDFMAEESDTVKTRVRLSSDGFSLPYVRQFDDDGEAIDDDDEAAY